jgi:hypothetical protein
MEGGFLNGLGKCWMAAWALSREKDWVHNILHACNDLVLTLMLIQSCNWQAHAMRMTAAGILAGGRSEGQGRRTCMEQHEQRSMNNGRDVRVCMTCHQLM